RAVRAHRGAEVHDVLAGVERCGEVFAPRLDPAHWTAEQPRRCRRHQLLTIERDLLAESAAHVGCDDAHRALGEAEARRERGADGMRDLRRVPEGERLVAGLPARQAAARLERRVRLAALVEAYLDDAIRSSERGLDVAVSEHAAVRTIRGDCVVD